MVSSKVKASILVSILGLTTVVTAFGMWFYIDSQRLKVGYVKYNVAHYPLVRGKANGMYMDYGLDVKFIEYKNDGKIMDAFMNGKLDIAYVGLVPVIRYHQNFALNVSVIAMASVNGSGIIVNNASGFNTAGDLQDKTIAIPHANGTQDFLLREYLNGTLEYGINGLENDTDDVNVVLLDNIAMPSAVSNTSASNIDAAACWEFTTSVASNLGFEGKTLVNSSDIWSNHPADVIIAKTSLVNSAHYRIVLSKFLEVHVDLVDELLASTHNDAVDMLQDTFFLAESVCDLAFNNTGFLYNVDNASVQLMVEKMDAYGMITPVSDVPGFIDGLLFLSILNGFLP
ncbi:MAG: ABC transporter substrate-binding protein [Promethearchaeota archaeon]